MSIEVTPEGKVTKDGEEIGTFDGKEFAPIEGLHHKTVKAVVAHLETIGDEQEKPKARKSTEEPAKDPTMGDLTPEYIEWHRRTKTKDEHEARYGKDESRLTRGEHQFPEGFKH